MYDVMVLGATFAAAGIASRFKKRCLVIEPSARAGYEFFGALAFGSEKLPETRQALALQESLRRSGGYIYDGDRFIYPYFRDADILFHTSVVSTEQKDGHFVLCAHGVDGFVSYEAKSIIDTRCGDPVSLSKTYNLLIESKEAPTFDNTAAVNGGLPHHYILRCPVPLSCSFPEARQIAQKYIARFSQTQKLILSADVFDYQVAAGYPKWENGILYLPSKAYENPALAFEAGFLTEGGAQK